MTTRYRIVLAACLCLGFASSVAARAPSVSYTADQASSGRLAFYEHCAECHGGDLGGAIGPALAGPDSKLQWETGKYVYGYMTVHMPHGNPGGLPASDYLVIMAFLYEQHHHVAGRKPLDRKAIDADTAEMGF